MVLEVGLRVTTHRS